MNKQHGKNNICILIPAYNEDAYIEAVISDCLEYGLDVIIVNDGSTDNTGKIVEKIASLNRDSVKILTHKINKGKGASLKTGFHEVIKDGYSGTITMDGDGQHDTKEIGVFLDSIEKKDPDIIIGSRFKDTKGMPFIRLATNHVTSWIISLIAGKKIEDVQSGFRYFKTAVIKNIKLNTNNFDTEPEILIKAGWMDYTILNIPIRTIYHEEFTSHVNPFTDTVKFFSLVFKSIWWKIRFNRSHTT